MQENISLTENIAYCGLYCGACRSFVKGKCPWCKNNDKASWCKIRSCCIDNNYRSCADCTIIELKNCKKFNNTIGKLFGLIFNSNRTACIERIREIGYNGFALEMDDSRMQTIKRR